MDDDLRVILHWNGPEPCRDPRTAVSISMTMTIYIYESIVLGFVCASSRLFSAKEITHGSQDRHSPPWGGVSTQIHFFLFFCFDSKFPILCLPVLFLL